VFHFLLAAVAVQFLRPEYDPWQAPLSLYLSGDWGMWLRTAYYGLALGVAVLALHLYRGLLPPARYPLVPVLLVAGAAALAATGARAPVGRARHAGRSHVGHGRLPAGGQRHAAAVGRPAPRPALARGGAAGAGARRAGLRRAVGARVVAGTAARGFAESGGRAVPGVAGTVRLAPARDRAALRLRRGAACRGTRRSASRSGARRCARTRPAGA